jgi:hypothetical protein
MPEHFHLLISEPEEGNPSKVMQVLKQRVARRLLAGRRNLRRQFSVIGCHTTTGMAEPNKTAALAKPGLGRGTRRSDRSSGEWIPPDAPAGFQTQYADLVIDYAVEPNYAKTRFLAPVFQFDHRCWIQERRYLQETCSTRADVVREDRLRKWVAASIRSSEVDSQSN